MLIKYDIQIRFASNASFAMPVERYVLRGFLNKFYDLICLKKENKCIDCNLKDDCSYYANTGCNFTKYAPFSIEYNPFSRKKFQPNDIYIVTIYIIKEMKYIAEYLKFYLSDSLKQLLQRNNVHIANIKINDYKLLSGYIEFDELQFKTILAMDSETNIIEVINEQLDYYNTNFDTNYSLITECEFINTKGIKTSLNTPFRVNSMTFKEHGYKNTYSFNNTIELPIDLIYLGIGKSHFIGNGKIKGVIL